MKPITCHLTIGYLFIIAGDVINASFKHQDMTVYPQPELNMLLIVQ